MEVYKVKFMGGHLPWLEQHDWQLKYLEVEVDDDFKVYWKSWRVARSLKFLDQLPPELRGPKLDIMELSVEWFFSTWNIPKFRFVYGWREMWKFNIIPGKSYVDEDLVSNLSRNRVRSQQPSHSFNSLQLSSMLTSSSTTFERSHPSTSALYMIRLPLLKLKVSASSPCVIQFQTRNSEKLTSSSATTRNRLSIQAPRPHLHLSQMRQPLMHPTTHALSQSTLYSKLSPQILGHDRSTCT